MIPKTLEDYCTLLRQGKPFTQANYCDGEWKAITGRAYSETCDGQAFNAEATKLLGETIRKPRPYFYGVIQEPWHDKGIAFCREHKWPVDDIQWVDKNITYRANAEGRAGAFWSALRARRVCMVGPAHLRRVTFLTFVDFVEVPSRNALDALKTLERQVLVAAARSQPDVICFSASFAAKVLIYRLWPDLGSWITLFDTGAMLDPYCGVFSRRHSQGAKGTELVRKNLAGMEPVVDEAPAEG